MLGRLLTLFLALVHMSAGLVLLLFSAWFIAASAIAGAGFNYMLPAVVIRALALIRIASGYGQMWSGHRQLLDQLSHIRLDLFSRCINGWLKNRGAGAEALTRHTEAVANIWIAWIAQNAGAIVILSIGLCTVIWLLPELASYAWLLLLAYVLISLWLIIAALLHSRYLVSVQQQFLQTSETQLDSVTLWPLQSKISLADATPLWQAWQKRQWLSDTGLLLLHASSLAIMVILLSRPVQPYAGESVLLILLMLLLAARDWLAPSLISHGTLADYQRAKQNLQQLEITQVTSQTLPEPVKTLTLTDFSAATLPVATINLSIAEKGVVLIKGSSGTGKSSLLRAICGLIPYQGERWLNGQRLAPGHIHHWHYSEQLPVCLSATLSDNLRIAKADASDQELIEALKLADLSELQCHLQQWLGNLGRRLSGGELKRLNLARAILTNATMLLLDEPFEGLAPSQQANMAQTLNRLAANRPVVIATHIVPQHLAVSAVLELEEEP